MAAPAPTWGATPGLPESHGWLAFGETSGGLCVAGLGGPTGRWDMAGAEDMAREGRSLGPGGGLVP